MFNENILTVIIQSLTAVIVAVIGTLGAIKFKKSKTQKLKYHPVFAKIDFDKSLVKTFEFKNRGKEIIFKDILLHHLSIYNQILDVFVKEIDNNIEMDSNELSNRAISAVSDIRYQLNNFYISDTGYTMSEKKALKIVLEKYNNWNFNRDSNMIEMISHVCGSTFYNTTYTKAVTILDLFLFAITETIEDANKTLNSLNGDLKGLKFKGVEI